MEDVGLVVVTGHGIAEATFESLHMSAGDFFNLSDIAKQQSFFIGMSAAMMRGDGAGDTSSCRWTWKRLTAPADGWNCPSRQTWHPESAEVAADSVP